MGYLLGVLKSICIGILIVAVAYLTLSNGIETRMKPIQDGTVTYTYRFPKGSVAAHDRYDTPDVDVSGRMYRDVDCDQGYCRVELDDGTVVWIRQVFVPEG